MRRLVTITSGRLPDFVRALRETHRSGEELGTDAKVEPDPGQHAATTKTARFVVSPQSTGGTP